MQLPAKSVRHRINLMQLPAVLIRHRVVLMRLPAIFVRHCIPTDATMRQIDASMVLRDATMVEKDATVHQTLSGRHHREPSATVALAAGTAGRSGFPPSGMGETPHGVRRFFPL
jgi:hypothetical protein